MTLERGDLPLSPKTQLCVCYYSCSASRPAALQPGLHAVRERACLCDWDTEKMSKQLDLRWRHLIVSCEGSRGQLKGIKSQCSLSFLNLLSFFFAMLHFIHMIQIFNPLARQRWEIPKVKISRNWSTSLFASSAGGNQFFFFPFFWPCPLLFDTVFCKWRWCNFISWSASWWMAEETQLVLFWTRFSAGSSQCFQIGLHVEVAPPHY